MSIIEYQDKQFILPSIIDELTDFSLISNCNDDPIILDFQHLTKINSYGIKRFLLAINQKPESHIIYKHCPVVLIDQLNFIPPLTRSNIKIESFYLPYYCEKCDNEKDMYMETASFTNKMKEEINSLFKCEHCSEEMELCSDDSVYFNFLKR